MVEADYHHSCVIGSDVDVDYATLIGELVRHGKPVVVRGLATVEVSPCWYTLTDTMRNVVRSPRRKLNHAFRWAELLWILTGQDDLEMVASYNSQLRRFSDDGKTLSGAYGPRVLSQLPYLLASLGTSTTRQAVISLWKENPTYSRDIPCTIMHHYILRGGRLDLVVYMRSNDLWLGFPYDVFVFTTLQRVVASQLGVLPGFYHHAVGSLHLYTTDLAKAKMYLPSLPYTPTPFYWPVSAGEPGEFFAMVDELKAAERLLRETLVLQEPPQRLWPWTEAFTTMHRHLTRHEQTAVP